MNKREFLKELETLINRHCIENASDTPDFILASYLMDCLNNFAAASRARDRWHHNQSDAPKSEQIQMVHEIAIDGIIHVPVGTSVCDAVQEVIQLFERTGIDFGGIIGPNNPAEFNEERHN
jgi:hypothetical protein